MELWIASIFHIADLHLFVDENGNSRPQSELDALVRLSRMIAKRDPLQVVKKLVGGFSSANMTALGALTRRLPQLIDDERRRADGQPQHVPILVLQTGDVETFGRAEWRARQGGDPYPGFSYLHKTLWPAARSAGADAVVDIFGNHDVWWATWPMLTPFKHFRRAFTEIAKVSGLAGPWPDRLDFAAPGGYRLEMYRINSIARSPLRNSLANGSVRAHPLSTNLRLTNSRNVFRELLALKAEGAMQPGRPVRVAAMHHPPHFFAGSLQDRFAGGQLAEGYRLARCFDYSGFQLVIAGHRHELDPGRHLTYDASEPSPNQPPLNSSTAQLVSESPTADPDLGGTSARKSLSLFRLHADGDRLRVERTVFRYRDAGATFTANNSRDAFRQIPLK